MQKTAPKILTNVFIVNSQSCVAVLLSIVCGKVGGVNGSATFTSSGTFIVPISVSSVHFLVVGGGAGGGSEHGGGGGSGDVQVGEVAVEPFDRISITVPTVGKGGRGSAYGQHNDNSQTTADGEPSAFGLNLTANGSNAVYKLGRRG